MALRVDWFGLRDDDAPTRPQRADDGAVADTLRENEPGPLLRDGFAPQPVWVSTLDMETGAATTDDPGVLHFAPPATAFSSALTPPTGQMQASPGIVHLPPEAQTPTLADEVAFIGGVDSNGVQPLDTFYAWNDDTPATYTGGYTNSRKWGAQTADTPGGTVSYAFSGSSNWSQTEKGFFTAGLALWSAVANVSFTLAASVGSAQIVFTRGSNGSASTNTHTTDNGLAHAGETGSQVLLQITSATISIDTSGNGFGPIQDFGTDGGYPIMTLLHEEGHALGLGHGGPYNGTVNEGQQQFSPYDTRLWSIMSYIEPQKATALYYNQYPIQDTSWHNNDPTGLMPLDILAVQALYGAPTSTPLSGGQVFGFNSNVAGPAGTFFDFNVNTHPIMTLWDAGSNNTLDLSGWVVQNTVNLNPGTFSSTNGLVDNLAIAFGTAIDTYVGGGGGDSVTGNNDGDTFTGNGGNDGFTGGTGIDTVVYHGNFADYTITDLSGGAHTMFRIVDNRPGSPDGTDVVSNAEKAVFADRTYFLSGSAPRSVPSDLNDDGKSDIVLQHNNGTPGVWLMDGTTILSSGTIIGNPGTAWHVRGTGDFNGDGKSDILWQNDDGTPAAWFMNGQSFAGGGVIAGSPGAAWHVQGSGDFNGDGKSDILWQNDDSTPAIWLLNGQTLLGGSGILGKVGTDWHVIGAGDFNGDGNADIVWQNDNGTPSVWFMNGLAYLGSASIVGSPGASWHIKGIGDFNGDGNSDLLWQNDNGAPAVWLLNGTSLLSGSSLANPGTAWHVDGAGDFNGDGKSDILWQGDNGTVAVWFMDGLNIVGMSSIDSSFGAGWHVASGGDPAANAAPAAAAVPSGESDAFVFHGGHESLGDFTTGEVVDLSGYGVADFADLQAMMVQSGADTVIAFDPQNDLTLHNVLMTQLTAGDFILS